MERHSFVVTNADDKWESMMLFIGTEILKIVKNQESILEFPNRKSFSFASLKKDEDDHGLSSEDKEKLFATVYKLNKDVFLYDDEEFVITIEEREDMYQQFRFKETTTFKRLTINFTNSVKLEKLIKETDDFYEEHFIGRSKKPECISIYTSDDSRFGWSHYKPKRSLETIYIPNKKSIVNGLEEIMKKETKELYHQLGIPYKLIVLLYGPPGSGKTTFIQALASHFNWDICTYFHNKKSDDTSFSKLLRNLRKRSFLVLEDMDCLFNTRETEDKTGITFSGILNSLDGFGSPSSDEQPFICFITTNKLERLDKTLVRPGRVDHLFEITYMSDEEIKKMFQFFMKDSWNTEFETQLLKKIKELRLKVTPCHFQLHFLKYLKKPFECIENLEEIQEIDRITKNKSSSIYS